MWWPLAFCMTSIYTRCRDDALPLLACQQMLKTQGLSHDTLAQCEPLIDTIPPRRS